MLPTTEAGSVQLRIAEPSDATEIFALASRVFGEKQFLYTVYQAPQSLKYVGRLITAGDANHRFILLKRDLELLGYYEALLRDGTCFLNYIATDPAVSGQGFGKLLLRDFEVMGCNSGCRQLSLDVFQSNTRAVAWYRNSGFREKSVTYLARIALRDAPHKNGMGLRIDKEDIDRALAEEREWGFSKLVCSCGVGCLTLGLIGGDVCKLLNFEGVTLKQALGGISVTFHPDRDIVIVSSHDKLDSSWGPLSTEITLRLTRPIDLE
jgi:ribosomal protein S18 acetylase RimI-like enzyme